MKDYNLMENNLTFSQALDHVKQGGKICRAGWNGRGMYVQLQIPDGHSLMTRPYLYMTIPAGSTTQFGPEGDKDQLVPWLVSQTDLMANDWCVLSS